MTSLYIYIMYLYSFECALMLTNLIQHYWMQCKESRPVCQKNDGSKGARPGVHMDLVDPGMRVFLCEDKDNGGMLLVRPSDAMCVSLKKYYHDPRLQAMKKDDKYLYVVDEARPTDGTKPRYAHALLSSKTNKRAHGSVLERCDQ